MLTRPLVEGENADADPARRAAIAAIFIIFNVFWYGRAIEFLMVLVHHTRRIAVNTKVLPGKGVCWYVMYRDLHRVQKDLCSTTKTDSQQSRKHI